MRRHERAKHHAAWKSDWGRPRSIKPNVEHVEGVGVEVIGADHTREERLPWRGRATARVERPRAVAGAAAGGDAHEGGALVRVGDAQLGRLGGDGASRLSPGKHGPSPVAA